MPDNLAVTRQLARFIAEAEWDALTQPVVHQTKCALVNFFAVAASRSFCSSSLSVIGLSSLPRAAR